MDFNKPFINNLLLPVMKIKNKCCTSQYLAEFQKSQFFPSDELKKIQREKLEKLLVFCLHSIPAYKKYEKYLSDGFNDPYELLARLPVLDKKEIKKAPDSFINPAVLKSNLIANQTGGSTGEPFRFYMDRFTVEHYEAARWRGLSWYGISQGSRSIMLWGNRVDIDRTAQKKYARKEKLLKNRILISAYDLREDKIGEYANLINRYKPEYIYGYASVLRLFVDLSLRCGVELNVNLKAVVSTAETLSDSDRNAIGAFFHCAVVNEYGARDAGILAYMCKKGSMHLSAENAITEILDFSLKHRLPDGESGAVVVTDLNNYSMPLLRYRLHDVAALSSETCGCGVTLPLLGNIEGRQDGIFITPEGRYVHGHIINSFGRGLMSVLKYQIRQTALDTAEMNIVLAPEFSQHDVDSFIKSVREMLRGVNITVKIVGDIPPEPSGKYRYAIREFDIV